MAIDSADVQTRDGVHGRIDDPTALDDPRTMSVPIRLDTGGEVWVPTHLLRRERDGTYTIDADLANAAHAERIANPPSTSSPLSGREEQRSTLTSVSGGEGESSREASVPVIEEQAEIGKRKVDTAVVSVNKTVHEEEQLVDEPLFREEVKIDRVPIGRMVDGPQQIRQEGDTTIVPLLEEVLVVEKRLMLKEELHITRVRWERHEQQRIPIRREEAHVERKEVTSSKQATQ